MQHIIEKLDQLAELERLQAQLAHDEQEAAESCIPLEVVKQMQAVHQEFAPKTLEVSMNLARLRSEIQAETLKLGKTVKGADRMAVFNKGRASWDSDGLNGFAVAHPEIKAFCKTGEPTITIRKVG